MKTKIIYHFDFEVEEFDSGKYSICGEWKENYGYIDVPVMVKDDKRNLMEIIIVAFIKRDEGRFMYE